MCLISSYNATFFKIKISNTATTVNKNTCVYGDQYVKEFLLKKNFKCFKNYSDIDAVKQRPFFAYKNVRNVKRSNPKDCELIWNESYKYSFYKKDISVGTLWFCN